MVDDSSSDPAEHFVKQRRYFIAVSLALIIYHIGDFKFNRISILGNDTDIQNPEVVRWGLYLLFLYYLWRYQSACNVVNGIGQFFRYFRGKSDQRIFELLRRRISKSAGVTRNDFGLNKPYKADQNNECYRHHEYDLTSSAFHLSAEQKKKVAGRFAV